MMNFIEKVPVPRPLPRPWIISSFVLRCICVCIDLQHAPTDNFTTADWLTLFKCWKILLLLSPLCTENVSAYYQFTFLTPKDGNLRYYLLVTCTMYFLKAPLMRNVQTVLDFYFKLYKVVFKIIKYMIINFQ